MRVHGRMQEFMSGRYGADQLSRVYMGAALGFLLLSLITRVQIFYGAGLGLLIYAYYRMFSRNISKRSEENQRFLNWRYHRAVKRNQSRVQREQRKVYRYFKCPGCRQKVRIPRGKGKVAVTCPKCRMEFIRRS